MAIFSSVILRHRPIRTRDDVSVHEYGSDYAGSALRWYKPVHWWSGRSDLYLRIFKVSCSLQTRHPKRGSVLCIIVHIFTMQPCIRIITFCRQVPPPLLRRLRFHTRMCHYHVWSKLRGLSVWVYRESPRFNRSLHS